MVIGGTFTKAYKGLCNNYQEGEGGGAKNESRKEKDYTIPPSQQRQISSDPAPYLPNIMTNPPPPQPPPQESKVREKILALSPKRDAIGNKTDCHEILNTALDPQNTTNKSKLAPDTN